MMHATLGIANAGGSTWNKVPKVHCANNKHSSEHYTFDTLDNAKQACATMGSACTGVYDGSCDNKDFYLCKDVLIPGKSLKASSSGSCVYMPAGEAVMS